LEFSQECKIVSTLTKCMEQCCTRKVSIDKSQGNHNPKAGYECMACICACIINCSPNVEGERHRAPAAGPVQAANTELRKVMSMTRKARLGLLALFASVMVASAPAAAQQQGKPNIILIVSDDFGYGDAGVYGGGPGRGMPTPNIDRLASEGVTFFTFYAQPSCTPGRAAMQTRRIPNRSGMTPVAFPGQGGGPPAAGWTLGSRL